MMIRRDGLHGRRDGGGGFGPVVVVLGVVVVAVLVLVLSGRGWTGGGAGGAGGVSAEARGSGASAGPAADSGAGAAVEERRLRIGAWNIEWLGKAGERSGFSRGVAQRPEVMARYILDSRAAVVGLAEIVTEMPGRPIRSRELEAVVERLVASGGQQWEYVLHPGRQRGDQLTGVM